MAQEATVLRIAVLTASYAESHGALKEVEDGYDISPANYFAPRWPPADTDGVSSIPEGATHYEFEHIPLHKRTAYQQVRELVTTGKFDCFFNLCDAAKDEDRAGVEVIAALEEFGVPYTGATSKHYEPTKDLMKRQLFYTGVKSPKGFVISKPEMIEQRCSRMRFPVIAKHASGYSSVGMTKDSKCTDIQSLVNVATAFIAEFGSVLVEEFIVGDEATVLACADPSAPGGIKVYPPVMMQFPAGEDFKHFDLKWNAYEDLGWKRIADDHPACARIREVGAIAFKHIMDGIGYGRSDVRITPDGEVYFLELNPNCGIMYKYGEEGSADMILRIAGANGSGHRDFIERQIQGAITRAEANQKVFDVVLDDPTDQYVLEAVVTIRKGRVVFTDEGRPTRLFTRDFVESTWDEAEQQVFNENAWPMGCDKHVYAVWDKDPSLWRPVSHSCSPNMRFNGRSLNVVACRDIAVGERLSMDYRTFMDSSMKPFECKCGAATCAGTIELNQTPWFLEKHEQGKTIDSFHRLSPNRGYTHMLEPTSPCGTPYSIKSRSPDANFGSVPSVS